MNRLFLIIFVAISIFCDISMITLSRTGYNYGTNKIQDKLFIVLAIVGSIAVVSFIICGYMLYGG